MDALQSLNVNDELCNYSEDIVRQINAFPHLFHLKIKGSVSFRKEKFKTLRFRLESEDVPDYGVYNEYAEHRRQMALSYVYFSLENAEYAMLLINDVLEKIPNYIPALCVKTRIHVKNEDFYEAQCCVDEINSCATNVQRATAEGHAELAYMYSRLGIQHYKQAAECYRQAIGLMSDNLLWKFELGKTLTRLMAGCVHSNEGEEIPILEEADKILEEVITAHEDSIQVLKGQAWVTRGNLRVKYIICCEFKGAKIKQNKKDTDRFFKCGFDLAPRDRYVLEEYGKHARFMRKYEQAKCCLTTAISIFPTSKSHHHIGLIHYGEWKFNMKKQPAAQKNAYTNLARSFSRETNGDSPLASHTLSNLRSDDKFKKRTSDIARFIRADGLSRVHPNNPLLLQAKDHFEKAVELSGCQNDVAMQDLGMVLMNLGDYREAHDVFKKINRVESKEQPVVVNSYEQRGICMHHMSADQEISEDESNSFRRNGQLMFMKAIELSSRLVVLNVPRQSYPVLHDMLRNESLSDDETKRTRALKDLAKLAELVKKYGDAIAILKDVSKINPDDKDAMVALARNYKKNGEYEQALVYMELLRCDRNHHTNFTFRQEELPRLYLDTNLQLGRRNLSNGNHGASTDNYRKAYDFLFNSSDEERRVMKNFSYDAMVVSNNDESDAIEANIVADALEERFSLKCWTYGRDASPCMPENKQYEDAIKASRNFIFLLESDGDSLMFDFLTDCIPKELIDRKQVRCNAVVLDSQEGGEIPKPLRHYPVIKHRHLDWESDSQDPSNYDALNDILHEFMTKLTIT